MTDKDCRNSCYFQQVSNCWRGVSRRDGEERGASAENAQVDREVRERI